MLNVWGDLRAIWLFPINPHSVAGKHSPHFSLAHLAEEANFFHWIIALDIPNQTSKFKTPDVTSEEFESFVTLLAIHSQQTMQFTNHFPKTRNQTSSQFPHTSSATFREITPRNKMKSASLLYNYFSQGEGSAISLASFALVALSRKKTIWSF